MPRIQRVEGISNVVGTLVTGNLERKPRKYTLVKELRPSASLNDRSMLFADFIVTVNTSIKHGSQLILPSDSEFNETIFFISKELAGYVSINQITPKYIETPLGRIRVHATLSVRITCDHNGSKCVDGYVARKHTGNKVDGIFGYNILKKLGLKYYVKAESTPDSSKLMFEPFEGYRFSWSAVLMEQSRSSSVYIPNEDPYKPVIEYTPSAGLDFDCDLHDYLDWDSNELNMY